MDLADLEQYPHTETWLRYAVYALIALGVTSCLLVGAGRPADPTLIPTPTTTVAPPAPPAPGAPGTPASQPAAPGSVAP